MCIQLQSGENTEAYPLSHSPDRQDACSIKVLIKLARLNKLIVLNILLHLLP